MLDPRPAGPPSPAPPGPPRPAPAPLQASLTEAGRATLQNLRACFICTRKYRIRLSFGVSQRLKYAGGVCFCFLWWKGEDSGRRGHGRWPGGSGAGTKPWPAQRAEPAAARPSLWGSPGHCALIPGMQKSTPVTEACPCGGGSNEGLVLSCRTPGLEDTHAPFSESARARHEEQTHLTERSFSLSIRNSALNYLQSWDFFFFFFTNRVSHNV